MRSTQLAMEGSFLLEDALKVFATNTGNMSIYLHKFRPAILCSIKEIIERNLAGGEGGWTPNYVTYTQDYYLSSEEAYIHGDLDGIEITFTIEKEPNNKLGEDGFLLLNVYDDGQGPLGMIRFRTTLRNSKIIVHEYDSVIFAEKKPLLIA